MLELIIIMALANSPAGPPPTAAALTGHLTATASEARVRVPLTLEFAGSGDSVDDHLALETRRNQRASRVERGDDVVLARRWQWFDSYGLQQRDGSRWIPARRETDLF